MNDFVTLKNSLGIEYKTGAVYLRQLDKYNFEHNNAQTLTKEMLKAGQYSALASQQQMTEAGSHLYVSLDVTCKVLVIMRPMSLITGSPFSIIKPKYIFCLRMKYKYSLKSVTPMFSDTIHLEDLMFCLPFTGFFTAAA